MELSIEQLFMVALGVAKRIPTKCEFHSLSNDYTIVSGNYIFYAYYRCKRRMMIKRIVLSPEGRIIAILNR